MQDKWNSGKDSCTPVVSFTRIVQEQENSTGRDNPARKPTWHRMEDVGFDPDILSEAGYSENLADGDSEKRNALYKRAISYLENVYAAVRRNEPFSLDGGIAIAEEVAEFSLGPDFLFILALHQDYQENHIRNHSVNVMVLAMKLSEILGFSRQKRVELGLAALLHDIGNGMIPEETIQKKLELTEKERRFFDQRPNFSYRLLEPFRKDHPYLPETAVQVHERVDGSGYPRGLKGDEILDYAQIIGLIDFYEALIHTRPQRERYLHFAAIKEIIRTGKQKFQRRYLKALLNSFSIFPLYSHVTLNSGAIGRVVGTYPDQPMRPKLKVILDSKKSRVLTERIIDLPEHPLLYIVDSIDEEEMFSLAEKNAAG